MKNHQRGFIGPLLLILIALLLVGGGAYVFTQNKEASPAVSGNVGLPQATSTTQTSNQTTPVTQTSNSKTDWKTYTDTQYGFSVDYPSDWVAKSDSGSTELGGIKYVTFGPTNSVNEKAALEVYPNQDSLDSLLKKFGYVGVWIDTTLDGVPAKEMILSGGQNTKRSVLILSVRNSYGYRLSSTGYEDNVGRVIKMGETFKFTSPTSMSNSSSANTTSGFSISPVSGKAPLSVTTPSFDVCQYNTIDWGDGSVVWSSGGAQRTCEFQNPLYDKASHTYNAPGTYTATLKSPSGSTTIKVVVSGS